jgi:hypothetical protein
VTTIRLPFTGPPLRSNARLHWAEKAKQTRRIRDAAAFAARLCGEVVAPPVTVTLVWTVIDNRRRDTGAASPTLKAALDGIVDAGLLPGDHSTVVVEERCRIEVGTTPGVRIEIEPAS